jgi:hypothetical protein
MPHGVSRKNRPLPRLSPMKAATDALLHSVRSRTTSNFKAAAALTRCIFHFFLSLDESGCWSFLFNWRSARGQENERYYKNPLIINVIC